jgi:hypothetical protein
MIQSIDVSYRTELDFGFAFLAVLGFELMAFTLQQTFL